MASPDEKRQILQGAKEKLVIMGYCSQGNVSRGIFPGFHDYEVRIKGDAKNIDKNNPNLIWAFDMRDQRESGEKVHRNFTLDRIAWFIIDGVSYDFRKDRTKIPKTMADIDQTPGVMVVRTANDPPEPGIILTRPKAVSGPPQPQQPQPADPVVKKDSPISKRDPLLKMIDKRQARLAAMIAIGERAKPKKRNALVDSVRKQDCTDHHWEWAGTVPRTGPEKCSMCGYRKEQIDEDGYLK